MIAQRQFQIAFVFLMDSWTWCYHKDKFEFISLLDEREELIERWERFGYVEPKY